MELSDKDLIQQILNGDIDLFEEIINRHKEKIFKIISSHIPDQNVEEVASDVFFKIYKGLQNFKNDSPFSHYISVIAVNTCRDYWKSVYSKKETNVSSFQEGLDNIIENQSSGVTPEDNILENERKRLLYRAIDTLNENERTVINMMYIEERSILDVANILNMTESNIKIISFRARKKLALKMNELMEAKLWIINTMKILLKLY